MPIPRSELEASATARGWVVTDDCPICGSARWRAVLVGRDDCHLCQCRACDGVFLNPRPRHDRTDSGYNHKHLQDVYLPRLVELGILSAAHEPDYALLDKRYRKLLDLTSALSPSEPVVDIGCAIGLSMLALNHHDIDTIGFDVDRTFIEGAQSIFGLDVRFRDVFDSTDSSRHPIAVANAVIEHIDEPVPFLRSIRKNVLTPGGALVVTVPNLASLEFIKTGPEEWDNIAGGHVWYPTETSMARVAKRAGFTVERIHVPPVRKGYTDYMDFYVRGVLGYEGNITGGLGMVLRA